MQYFFASNEFILYQNQDTAIIYKKNIRINFPKFCYKFEWNRSHIKNKLCIFLTKLTLLKHKLAKK